jgi:hypothetical protein
VVQLEWWTRIWTVQECVLPYHAIVIHGPFTLPWRTMLKAAACFDYRLDSCCGALVSRHWLVLKDFAWIDFQADYFLSIEQLFERTIVQLIEDTGSLNVLSVDLRRSDDIKLPSWVIDWRFSNPTTDLIRYLRLFLLHPHSCLSQ